MSLPLEEQLLFNYLKIVSVSPYEETENVYREISASSGRQHESEKCLNSVLTLINNVIKKYDLEIVEAIDENSSKKIHCLICTDNNSIVQKASFYDKTTCELLSKIIQECVTSDSGSISQITCLNLSLNTKTNKTNMQASLERLIKDKWLASENGKVSLGIRCRLELEITIAKQYPNFVKYCGLCKKLVMQGFTCPECESHAHLHCIDKYNEMNRLPETSRICPICKESINNAIGDYTKDGEHNNRQETTDTEDVDMGYTEVAITGPPTKRSKRSF